MKFIILLFIGFFSTVALNAQIQNGSFENWTGGEPDYWKTSNNPENFPGAVNITKTTFAYKDSFAVRGEVIPIGQGSLRPYIATGNTNGPLGFPGYPFTDRPYKLRGYFLFQPVGVTTTFSVNVYLTKWIGNETKIVGSGGFTVFNNFLLDSIYTGFDAQINYTLPDNPDTVAISFSVLGSIGSVFYLDDISFTSINIIKPEENETIIAGEKDTIRWAAAPENINILYSLDKGITFTTIESNYPSDSVKYIWDVPNDLLSAKARIRIVDSQDNNNYDEKEVKIKPWQLSKIDENGDYITPLFQPNMDGWSFDNSGGNVWPQSWWQQFNYQNGTDPYTAQFYPFISPFDFANSSDFMDWEVFVDVFGVQSCYLSTSSIPATYRSRAITTWAGIKGNWGGSCYGFAVSSILAYYNKGALINRFPGIGSFSRLNGVSLSDDARKAINTFFTYQYGDPFDSYTTQRWNSVNARETLAELKEMFERDNGDGKTLLFYSNDSTSPGGHMVTPYKLERIGDTPVFNLRVYDSNDPGSSNQIIKIDSAANTWTDQTGLGWGTGTTGAILNLENAVHLTIPTLPKNNSKARGYNEYPKFPSGGLQLFNNSRNGILITNDFGETIGFSDSVLVQNITDALPIIPKTGNVHPPIGYRIPPGNYSVELNNLVDSLAYLIFMQDSIIYNYFRSDAEVDQLDQVYFNEGIAFKNSDQVAKNIMLQTVLDDENSEKVFLIENMNLTHNDSVFFSESDRDKLIIKNYGQNKNYDLWLRSASDNGQSIFIHPAIPQNFNSSHTIVPDWNDLQNQPVKILVDLGNNGTIDDSIFVNNQFTNIEDRGSLLSPNSFNLAQNYPNPFNPSTTIKFSLPENSMVTLKVYNIVGEEVATLINEERDRGIHSVDFDASKLSSGVYFYKIQAVPLGRQAGFFTETKKMLYLK